MSIKQYLPNEKDVVLHKYGCGIFCIENDKVDYVDSLSAHEIKNMLFHCFGYGYPTDDTSVLDIQYDAENWINRHFRSSRDTESMGGITRAMGHDNMWAWITEMQQRQLITPNISIDNYLRFMYFSLISTVFTWTKKKLFMPVKLSKRAHIEGLKSEHPGVIINVGYGSLNSEYDYLVQFDNVDLPVNCSYSQLKRT